MQLDLGLQVAFCEWGEGVALLEATTKIFPYQPLQVYEISRFVQPVQCEMYLPSHWNCKACRFSVLLEVSHPEVLRERERERERNVLCVRLVQL